VALVRVGPGRWTLPKGLVENGEGHEEAALREVREESGLDASVITELDTVDYWFYWAPEKTRYHKFVHFYLMRHLGGSTSQHDDEVEEVAWFDCDAALRAVAYPSEARVLAQAREALAETANGDKE
jgi:8-oxo-dGTP pyrophosphatase MutT (NUDIX family)